VTMSAPAMAPTCATNEGRHEFPLWMTSCGRCRTRTGHRGQGDRCSGLGANRRRGQARGTGGARPRSRCSASGAAW
jgi:hypothetical protein